MTDISVDTAKDIEATPIAVEEKKVLEEELDAAFEEEFGKDWLEDKTFAFAAGVNFLRFLVVLGALYFFLVSLGLMGDAFTALAGKGAGELFGEVNSPIIGLMIGVIATVLVQSSSTTTSIMVVLVGSDLLSVTNAIPMVMGANIGTTVTNTLVSLGFADDPVAYERGFAGATVHDMFNYLNVLVLLPLELLVAALRKDGGGGLLQSLAHLTASKRNHTEVFEGGDSYKDANPIKKITGPIIEALIILDKKAIEDAAKRFPELQDTCPFDYSFRSNQADLPTDWCKPNSDPAKGPKCNFCDSTNGTEFVNEDKWNLALEEFNAQRLIVGGKFGNFSDSGGGAFCLVLSIVMLILSLSIIVKTLTLVVRGGAKKILVRALNYDFVGGAYLSILIGCLITLLVQSSSITTSILTPLVAVGTLKVDNMFPFTLGANIGTTATGLIAAFASDSVTGFEIALVHMYFNIVGTLLWFPAPFMRAIPLNCAKFLGHMAGIMRIFPVIYILLAFIVYPLVFFAFSLGFQGESIAGKTFSGILLTGFLAGHVYIAYWYRKRDGKAKFLAFVKAREERLNAARAAKKKASGKPIEGSNVAIGNAPAQNASL